MQLVPGPRGWTRAALAGALVLILAACGGKPAEPLDHNGSAPEYTPVTITHAHGATILTAIPKRIVALGNQWLDTVQALGITPIAYIDPLTAAGSAPPPWEPATLESAKPLDTTTALPAQLAPLHPDLILADPFLADATTYTDLTKVAPTIPGLAKAAATPWPDLLRALGRAVHHEPAAEKLITDLNSRITAIPQRNPTLKSKTFTITWLSAPTQLLVLTDPQDATNTLLTQLGMTIPTHLTTPTGHLPLPPNRLPELDADLLLAAYSPGLDETYRALPGFTALPAVQKNAVVFLTTEELSTLNQPTPLALPHLLDKLEPALAHAAA
ncbi:ABC transporter substrate-binding protein [Nocardia sp. SYP-A9097]|uniref:ABC transporter substrate-binding protein n=1 Tax=Nocardia sp. SYP-A9097 TaxID=2663237 RepID=UPI00129A6F6D|nr:ABC transporter substrate-binding protein [Nocardia sp. SYP-A9097]MRH91590.1 ABC transporter substrate-binding protein [Nocardia sp. SYP-A9097]